MKTEEILITATPLTPASSWMLYFKDHEVVLTHPRGRDPRAILSEKLGTENFIVNYKPHQHEQEMGTLF